MSFSQYLPGDPAVLMRNEPYIRYEISFGDSLFELARVYHTSVSVLCEINNIADPGQLLPGNILLIPTEP